MKIPVNPQDVERELYQRSLFEFVQDFWPVIESHEMRLNWHIEYICTELEHVARKIVDGEHKDYDLVINIPPGTTKSTLVTIMLPAWMWAVSPGTRIISTSYSHSLSITHAIKSRDIILSDKFQALWGVNIKKDQSGKQEYANTERGERIATSIGGSITGKHGDLIIIDDPINPKMASSDAERQAANTYISDTLHTRKTDKEVTATILIMQRLHQDDPTGLFLDKGTVRHICLPGELSDNVHPPELTENYQDGLLDPVRLSRDALTELKTDLGSYGYSGQIMQSPAPEGGGIWQTEWFQTIPDKDFPTNFEQYGTDWDLAYTKNDENSASAYVVSGVKQNQIYIDEVGWDWLEFPGLIGLMKNKPSPHYVENKASGKSAVQTLTQQGVNAIPANLATSQDKIARARMATPTVEAGRVYVRESQFSKLMHDHKQGLIYFPNGSNDDVSDVLAQCIIRLSTAKKAKARRAKPRGF